MSRNLRQFLTGIAPVEAALLARRRQIHRLWVSTSRLSDSEYDGDKDNRLSGILRLASEQNLDVISSSREDLTRLLTKYYGSQSDGKWVHQGVVAECDEMISTHVSSLFPWLEHREICFKGEKDQSGVVVKFPLPRGRKYPLVLALDSVQDPGNLGAILRTAFWLSVPVVFSEQNCSSLTPFVYKSSQGAAELQPPLATHGGLVGFLKRSQQSQWKVWVTKAFAHDEKGEANDGAHRQLFLGNSLSDIRTHPSIVVLGGESKGVRSAIRWLADGFLSIPGPAQPESSGAHLIDSLNVSVASGIIIWDLTRQRDG